MRCPSVTPFATLIIFSRVLHPQPDYFYDSQHSLAYTLLRFLFSSSQSFEHTLATTDTRAGPDIDFPLLDSSAGSEFPF